MAMQLVEYKRNLTVEREERVSIVYTLLPASIQHLLPPIPSIRQTVTLPMRAISTMHSFSMGASAPIPAVETAGVMAVATREEADVTEDLAFSTARTVAMTLSMQHTAAPTLRAQPGATAGVDWKFAGHGLEFALCSGRESRCRLGPDYNAPFERETYITSVKYMLRGLPRDLDESEAQGLRLAMPPALATALSASDVSQRRDSPKYRRPQPRTQQPRVCWPEEKNIVHIAVAAILRFMSWVTPYVILFATSTYRYERKKRILWGITTSIIAGLDAFRRMGEGLAGQAFSDVVDYTVQGALGAMREYFAKEALMRQDIDEMW